MSDGWTIARRRTTADNVRLGLVALAVMLLGGCATGSRPQRADPAARYSPARYLPIAHVSHSPHAKTLTVTTAGGCPATIGAAVDVAVHRDLHLRLLPETKPRAALVCAYLPSPAAGSDRSVLAKAIMLSRGPAARVAAAANRISLAPITGTFHCPADFGGAVTVVAFAYSPTRTVDLWWKTSGCQTLDNGDAIAHWVVNPSFYDRFVPLFDRLTHMNM